MGLDMPNIPKLTQAERNEIRQASVYALPNKPSALGMRAEEIKKAFWMPILAENGSALGAADRIAEAANEYLERAYLHAGEGDVEAIESEYKEFLREGESGLTANANALWRILTDHIEVQTAAFLELARYVQEALTQATAAMNSKDSAQGYAADAQDSSISAEERSIEASTIATTAADERSAAEDFAGSAVQSESESRAVTEETRLAFANLGKMEPSASMTFQVSNNADGKVVFTYETSAPLLLRDDNTMVLAQLVNGVENKPAFFDGIRHGVFASRIVEIVIEDPAENPFGDRILYRERCGGCVTFAEGLTESYVGNTNDENGDGYTRIVREYHPGKTSATVVLNYYLRLSYSLAEALRMRVAATDEIFEIHFKGYN